MGPPRHVSGEEGQLQSSYLQTNDYAPVLGATWNRPLRLTANWRAITNGEPAVVTKIVSPIFAQDRLEVDVWPLARPRAGARLHVEREDLKPNPRWRGVHFTETLLPADGNPNHLHLTVTRAAPYKLDFGGDGDVTNPDSMADLQRKFDLDVSKTFSSLQRNTMTADVDASIGVDQQGATKRYHGIVLPQGPNAPGAAIQAQIRTSDPRR